MARYSDEQTRIDGLASQRRPEGVVCPRCGSDSPHWMQSVKRWKCHNPECRPRRFSVKVGTISEDGPIGLCKWLPAVWLIVNAKSGISSYRVARVSGVTQKTARLMLRRVHLAIQDEDDGKLHGEVEIDETYIGGLARSMHKGRRAAKIIGTGGAGETAAMGLLQREVQVRTEVAPNVRRGTLQPGVRRHVAPGRRSSVMPCTHTKAWMTPSFTRSPTTPRLTSGAGFIPTASRATGVS